MTRARTQKNTTETDRTTKWCQCPCQRRFRCVHVRFRLNLSTVGRSTLVWPVVVAAFVNTWQHLRSSSSSCVVVVVVVGVVVVVVVYSSTDENNNNSGVTTRSNTTYRVVVVEVVTAVVVIAYDTAVTGHKYESPERFPRYDDWRTHAYS